MNANQTPFQLWDGISKGRERFRERTRLGVDGETMEYSASEMLKTLNKMSKAVQKGLEKALNFFEGIAPTYFSFQADEYEIQDETDPENRPIIKPTSFKANPLPLFLEGPVHQLKILTDPEESIKLYHKVKESQLFDHVLETYKLNTSLMDQPHSIGRARAFSRGWLENESVWLHMTFKYLLEVLKSGLYQEFYEDIQRCLPPFLDPDIYGRSPLENSSFIVSSAHPDPSLHGRGFVARLTGATAEFISIWFLIMTGGKPFFLDPQGKLQFSLQPKLPGWLFTDEGVLSYRFLGRILVRVHNPSRLDTWTTTPVSYTLKGPDNEVTIEDYSIGEQYAITIRDGQITEIDIYY
jgi:hypothetical protein